MLRFLSRFLGIWLIAAALVVAVIDGAKSIAASTVVMTPLAESWALLTSFGGSAETEAAGGGGAPWPLDILLPRLMEAPTAAVLAVLGVLLLLAGRRRRHAYFGREFAA